ncbi:MAG: hypothetical protein KKB82_03835 [Candidatus Omnitrophica bacterium]|nr:hypothetical protein [Candidatus Omnitrophota bacterium]MBU1925035.1 hypothetical protein [Candidatus Omnitrophota bacterium]
MAKGTQQLNKILIIGVLVLFIAVLLIIFRLISVHKRSNALNSQNVMLFAEKIKLEKELARETQVWTAEKSNLIRELVELKDVKSIKAALDNAREKLAGLTGEYESINKEKEALQEKNRSLNSRVDSISKEFSKNLEELKTAKKELGAAKSGSLMREYQAKYTKTEALLKKKEEEIVKLKEKLKNSETDSENTRKENINLQRQISGLEKERDMLKQNLERVQQKLEPVTISKSKIRELETRLSDNNKKYALLKKDLEKAIKERGSLEGRLQQAQQLLTLLQKQAREELGAAKEKLAKYEQLKADKERLEQALVQLEQDRRSDTGKTEELRIKLDTVLNQLGQKENEVTALRSDISSLQTERMQLSGQSGERLSRAQKKSRSSDMQLNQGQNVEINQMGETSEGMQNKLNRAYALYDTAKSQVVKISELLMHKELELEKSKNTIEKLQEKAGNIPDLEAKMEFLNKTILEKEKKVEEQTGQIAQLSKSKADLEERLNEQLERHDNVDSLYKNLKSQVIQMADLLAQRELDLDNKNTEILNLRSETTRLEADLRIGKTTLEEAKVRQRRTLEDLRRATNLNATLQEKLINLYKAETWDSEFEADPKSSEDKEKAEQLKQKLELLLDK